MRLKPLAEQVIVVTGASSGIGLATARRAAREGACVVLVARSADTLAWIAGEIGDTALACPADVAEPGALRAAARAAVARFGRIDAWVHAAGAAIYAPLRETPREEHEALFRTNYFGVVESCLAALPHLEQAGGALVVVGSIVGDIGTPVLGAYAASKHAVKGYVDSLRIELTHAGSPVSLTLVKPSGIDTPVGRHAANHGAGALAGEAKAPPPLYSPDAVAEAILHACTRPVREVTVGGVGLAQTLFGVHFPALFDRLAGLLPPLLFDPALPDPDGDALAGPVGDGVESVRGGGRASLTTRARLHPTATLIGLGIVAGLVWVGRTASPARRARLS